MERWATFLLSLLIISAASAQTVADADAYRHLGILLNAGSIFAHSKDVENIAGSVPYGFEIEFSKRNLSRDAWRTCQCYPTTGFILGYSNYDNKVLGHGIHVSYFLEHIFLPFRKWSPVIRGAAGFAYSTNPHHAEENPDNQSYSLPVNAFLQLQGGFNLMLGETGMVTLRAGYNHVSNGGIKEPNKGINWPNIAVGYMHMFDYQSPQRREKRELSDEDKVWLKRVEILGAYTTRVFEKKESFFAYGAMGSLSRKFAPMHGISAAAEWHYHEEMARRIEWQEESVSAHRAAVLIGHDFLFGKVVFSQQIGVYVYDEFRHYDPIYHRWTLSYVLPNGFSFGTSLKAHRHVAEFLDVRIGFHW